MNRDRIIVAHWNGQRGDIESGPYCDTWDMPFPDREVAQTYADDLEARSCGGWHCRAEVMTAGEYWDILADIREG